MTWMTHAEDQAMPPSNKSHSLLLWRPQEPHDRPIERLVVVLDDLGWRVVELRPLLNDGEVALWCVAARRVDLDAYMRMTAADLDVALAELVRYASADAAGDR